MNCARSFIAVVCGSFSLFFGSAASADDSSNVLYRASVDDLTPQEFEDLAGLALALRATSSSSNITNDVAAILAILQMYSTVTTGLFTYPRGTGGLNLSRYLWSGLFDASGNDGTPNKANSFLKKILDTLQTTGATTNDVADIVYYLNQINKDIGTITDIDSKLYYQRQDTVTIKQTLEALLAYQQRLEYGAHSLEWAAHVNDGQWDALLGAIGGISNSVTFGIGPGFDQVSDAVTNLQISLEANLDDLRAFLGTNLVAGSFRLLDQEVDDAMDTGDDGIEAEDLPDYEDLFTESSPDEESDAIEAGYNVLQDHVDAYSRLVGTGGDPEIVIVPEMDLGGIHVDEVKGSLDTPITTVVHGVMSFIWGVGCFAALFALASSEYAFYANLGRNWTTSKY